MSFPISKFSYIKIAVCISDCSTAMRQPSFKISLIGALRIALRIIHCSIGRSIDVFLWLKG